MYAARGCFALLRRSRLGVSPRALRTSLGVLTALATLACSTPLSGVVGGGKPTVITCEGKGIVVIDRIMMSGNCEGEKPFKLEVNIQ